MNDKSPLDAALNQRSSRPAFAPPAKAALNAVHSSWMHVSDKSVPTGRLAQAASKSMQRRTVNTRKER